jgi:8-oxo-dGTP diphosphatase
LVSIGAVLHYNSTAMASNEPGTIVVVAALIIEGRRLLACQRRAHGAFPLKWEFPGGKIEMGEEPAEALARELREELAIEIVGSEKIYAHRHVYPGFSAVHLQFFHVADYRGRLINRVFEQIRWVGPEELARLDFLDGDRPVIEWLLKGSGSALWSGREP